MEAVLEDDEVQTTEAVERFFDAAGRWDWPTQLDTIDQACSEFQPPQSGFQPPRLFHTHSAPIIDLLNPCPAIYFGKSRRRWCPAPLKSALRAGGA